MTTDETTTAEQDNHHLALSIAAATSSIYEGGGPFGAVLVTKDGNVYKGTDRVLLINDPTAHAEMVAIREASSAEANYDLSGSTLYSSCQPCPMCLTAALWARVSRIVYAATAAQAAAAGFDDASFYQQLSRGLDTVVDAEIDHLDLAEANGPFEAWGRYEGRVDF